MEVCAAGRMHFCDRREFSAAGDKGEGASRNGRSADCVWAPRCDCYQALAAGAAMPSREMKQDRALRHARAACSIRCRNSRNKRNRGFSGELPVEFNRRQRKSSQMLGLRQDAIIGRIISVWRGWACQRFPSARGYGSSSHWKMDRCLVL
jgi:hypothetical protein